MRLTQNTLSTRWTCSSIAAPIATRCRRWRTRRSAGAATLRELGSSRQLSRQDRALALAFFNTVAAPSPNRYLRNAAFEVARAESRHERAVERADEAFEAYRFAIVDAVLYWARSHSRPSAAGPRRRQPVRSTRTGPYGAAVADARS